jgi:hypothetical protein
VEVVNNFILELDKN